MRLFRYGLRYLLLVVFLAACGGGGGSGGGGGAPNTDNSCSFLFDIPDSDSTWSVASGDFNADGYLDLAVARRHFDSSDCSTLIDGDSWIEVFLQDRLSPGHFLFPTTYPIGRGGGGVTAADVNGDDRLDLVSANADDISILLGASATPGAFQTAANISITNPNNVAVGDVDGDNDPDLLVSTFQFAVLLYDSNAETRFDLDPEVPSDGWLSYVALADLNLDGRNDLVVAVGGDSGGAVEVLLQDSSVPVAFLAPQAYSVDDPNVNVVSTADLNADGLLDVVVGSSPGRLNNVPHLSVFLNNPSAPGTLLAPRRYSSCSFVDGLVIRDVNNDSAPDIVVAGQRNQAACLAVHLQSTSFSGTFETPSFYSGRGSGVLVKGPLTTDDLNGDGLVDIALANDGVGIFFQQPGSPGLFQSQTRLFDDD